MDHIRFESKKAYQIKEIVVGRRIVTKLFPQGACPVFIDVRIPRQKEAGIVTTHAGEKQNTHHHAKNRNHEDEYQKIMVVEPRQKTIVRLCKKAIKTAILLDDLLPMALTFSFMFFLFLATCSL